MPGTIGRTRHFRPDLAVALSAFYRASPRLTIATLVVATLFGLLQPTFVIATGVLVHNRGTGFALDEEHPNVIAPGKRPAHTLMPVIVERAGALLGVLGTMGGKVQELRPSERGQIAVCEDPQGAEFSLISTTRQN